MTGSPRREDDPELEDVRGLPAKAVGGRAGLVAVLVLLGVGLALWAYLR